MNTLFLDNNNLQAECQQGVEDPTQYRLGSITSLSYTGTQDCGCNPYITQYCYPACDIASAPNGVVGTSSTEGSPTADAHYAATQTLTYIRDVLGVDGVGQNSGQTVPVFTVLYPNDYREPTPCLDNQPEWIPLSGGTTSAVLLCKYNCTSGGYLHQSEDASVRKTDMLTLLYAFDLPLMPIDRRMQRQSSSIGRHCCSRNHARRYLLLQ